MRFYFDIEFLETLQNNVEIDQYIFEDFKYFIENLLDAECFLINEIDIDYSLFSRNVFIRLLTRMPNYKEISLTEHSFDLHKDNYCFKFYFLNQKDSVQEIRSKYGYYACSTFELNITWRKFHSRRANEDLKRYIGESRNKYQFSSWEDLTEFSLPINTLLISDQYLFEFLDTFKYNFEGLLKNMRLTPLSKRTIDIVIITSENIFTKDNELSEQNFDSRFERAFNESKISIGKFLKEEEFNLTLIKLDKKSNPPSFKAHFRSCVTNTTFINPHHSFTIFGPKNKIRKNDYIDFTSFLWVGPRQNAKDGVFKVAQEAMAKINNETKEYNKISAQFIFPKRLFVHNEKRVGLME